jgi:hypothetical protein
MPGLICRNTTRIHLRSEEGSTRPTLSGRFANSMNCPTSSKEGWIGATQSPRNISINSQKNVPPSSCGKLSYPVPTQVHTKLISQVRRIRSRIVCGRTASRFTHRPRPLPSVRNYPAPYCVVLLGYIRVYTGHCSWYGPRREPGL